jgi:hypothetical protein
VQTHSWGTQSLFSAVTWHPVWVAANCEHESLKPPREAEGLGNAFRDISNERVSAPPMRIHGCSASVHAADGPITAVAVTRELGFVGVMPI